MMRTLSIFTGALPHFAAHTEPLLGIVRLEEAQPIPDFYAGRRPLRFAVLILGASASRCREMGRAIGTLLAVPV
ncbi:unnamed protein product [Sphagnum balticum]